MATTGADLVNKVIVAIKMDNIRLQTTFLCNRTMDEVTGYYSMATKMYDVNMLDFGQFTSCRPDDYGDLHVCLSDELIDKLYELFAYDEVGLALVRRDNNQEVVLTMENANVLVMHYVRTLCPDLRWVIKESFKTVPQYKNPYYDY